MNMKKGIKNAPNIMIMTCNMYYSKISEYGKACIPPYLKIILGKLNFVKEI